MKFDPSINSINCTFLNKQDTSNKWCSVVYGQCLQTTQSAQGNVTDSMNTVILTLTLDDQTQLCYTVTASNEDYTVEVFGSFKSGKFYVTMSQP